MKIHQLIEQYVRYRRSLGEKFKTNETCLKAFCSTVGPETHIKAITERMTHRYLYGKSKAVTTGWFVKHIALLGLYQYAVTRNYVTTIPLPKTLPRRPQGLIPYIYSQRELKLLFDGALTYQKNKSHIEPFAIRNFLMLTYTLGLRVHETLSITLGDIDMDNQVITVQQSKFYKSRLVPFNRQVKKLLKRHLQWRKDNQQPQQAEACLFMNQHGRPLNGDSLRDIFQRIRVNTGIQRTDGAYFQPRLHDLRHTFAVNRLLSWYRENRDVQQLLPLLSVYMGHKYLAHTSVYLSITDDLLSEANNRFEKYAKTRKS
jgi:site-specific recombinase XerD